MIKSAVFSECRRYRYSLTRTWDESQPYVMFIGLNPSTADENVDDPTIRRCVSFAKLWGYGGIVMCNLFAFRSTDPRIMMAEVDCEGELNEDYLLSVSSNAGLIVAAWGNYGMHLAADMVCCNLLHNYTIYCFGTNKSGQPSHPLYQSNNCTLKILE